MPCEPADFCFSERGCRLPPGKKFRPETGCSIGFPDRRSRICISSQKRKILWIKIQLLWDTEIPKKVPVFRNFQKNIRSFREKQFSPREYFCEKPADFTQKMKTMWRIFPKEKGN